MVLKPISLGYVFTDHLIWPLHDCNYGYCYCYTPVLGAYYIIICIIVAIIIIITWNWCRFRIQKNCHMQLQCKLLLRISYTEMRKELHYKMHTCTILLLCMELRWGCKRQKKFRKSVFGSADALPCYTGSGHYVSERSDTNASHPPFIGRGRSLCQTRGAAVFHFRFEITRVMYTHACYDNNNNNNNTNGGQKGCVFTNFHRARLSTPDPYIYIYYKLYATLFAVFITNASRAVCDVV